MAAFGGGGGASHGGTGIASTAPLATPRHGRGRRSCRSPRSHHHHHRRRRRLPRRRRGRAWRLRLAASHTKNRTKNASPHLTSLTKPSQTTPLPTTPHHTTPTPTFLLARAHPGQLRFAGSLAVLPGQVPRRAHSPAAHHPALPCPPTPPPLPPPLPPRRPIKSSPTQCWATCTSSLASPPRRATHLHASHVRLMHPSSRSPHPPHAPCPPSPPPTHPSPALLHNPTPRPSTVDASRIVFRRFGPRPPHPRRLPLQRS